MCKGEGHTYNPIKAKRKQLDAQLADAEDIKMLEDLEKSIIEKRKGKIKGKAYGETRELFVAPQKNCFPN